MIFKLKQSNCSSTLPKHYTTLYSSLNIVSAALIAHTDYKPESIARLPVVVISRRARRRPDAGDTKTPLTILLRGSFKLDNNDSIAISGMAQEGKQLPWYNIRRISRFQPNYFPASGSTAAVAAASAMKQRRTRVRPSPPTSLGELPLTQHGVRWVK